jgi:hypothetical protein
MNGLTTTEKGGIAEIAIANAAIAGWCPELERCYLLPIEEIDGQSMIHLRLSPARNNQRTGVKLAAQYELGAVAQLGERCHGMAEVRGSSPLSSTGPKAA